MELIGLIDCNNFFVSCERLFRPDLVNRPAIVLSSNDGCVVARSQEVKDMGIAMGVPYFQIKDIIKDKGIICFSSHFSLYQDISKRVFNVVKSSVEKMERYSIDEAFFSLSADDEDCAREKIRSLKQAVETRVGIPVSVAVARTKTQVKLVNNFAKKNSGIAVCINDFALNFGQVKIGEVWGIGSHSVQDYKQAGITTVQSFLDGDKARIKSLFGVVGARLRHELDGVVMDSVSESKKIPASITSSRSFGAKTDNLSIIKDALAHHVRSVFADMKKNNLCASEIAILLLPSQKGDYKFHGGTARASVTSPVCDVFTALKIALSLLDSFYEKQIPYTKVGCICSGLLPKELVTQSLFQENQNNNLIIIDNLTGSLNQRFGPKALKVGYFSRESSWESKRDLLSPNYTTNWSEIISVKAI